MQFCFYIGFDKKTAVEYANRLGFTAGCVDSAADIFLKLYNLFMEKDCTLLEINPFTELNNGDGMYVQDSKSSLH